MEERFVLTRRELTRAQVVGLIAEGQLSLQEGASRLGLSPRQVQRLVAKLRTEGVRGLRHGNRGRVPANRLPAALRQHIVQLATGPYADLNDTHFQELLAEREGIHLGRETLRTLLRQAGQRAKRQRRPPRHHRRRVRSPAKGLLVLWDGSPHPWFGPTEPPCTLMAAVDDADGEVVAALFTPHETSAAYRQLLQGIIQRRGVPVAIYQDRHSALKRNDGHWTLEEQIQGQQHPTQVGMALRDLGIRPIFALSPQAKGRVERLFGVLQDRLLAEMRLDGIVGIEAGNRYLPRWLRRYNQRFCQPPAVPTPSYRSRQGLDLYRLLAFRYPATVANDNTVSVGGQRIDIPPGPHRRSYAHAHVEVRQHLDGAWSVYYQDHCIAQASATPLAEPLKVRTKSHRTKGTPGADEAVWLYLPTGSFQEADMFPRQ